MKIHYDSDVILFPRADKTHEDVASDIITRLFRDHPEWDGLAMNTEVTPRPDGTALFSVKVYDPQGIRLADSLVIYATVLLIATVAIWYATHH